MAVSKRLRYEVFRRDDFTCRYCGAKPPGVSLTTDHVVPVTLGGQDEPGNLVTACAPCNSGKTSTTPDAPLVADVSEEALRWSRALAEAAAAMRAGLAGRRDIYRRFDELWCGYRKLELPRPDDWRASVDGFLAAGLPLEVLEWCVTKAMGSKAKPDQTWRYMCGIAWKKVTELQEAARLVARGTTGDGAALDEETLTPGRADLARELLGDLDADHLGLLLEDARDQWQAESDDEQHIAAAHIAWQEVRTGLSWLAFSVCELLPAIPGEVMQSALRQARAELYDENGEDFSRIEFAQRAADIATRRYEPAREMAAPF